LLSPLAKEVGVDLYYCFFMSKKYLQNKQDGVFFCTLPQINPNCGFVIGYLLFPPLRRRVRVDSLVK